MAPYTHLIERELELHRQDLMRQAETERFLRQVPRNQRSMIRDATGKLGILLPGNLASCYSSLVPD